MRFGERSGQGLYDTFNPYPRPRQNRGRGIPTNNNQPTVADLANVRQWGGIVNANAASRRSTLASPRFSGPVFLHSLHYSNQGHGLTTPLSEVQLYYNTVAYTTEFNSLTLTGLDGSPVWERTRGAANEDSTASLNGTIVPDLLNGGEVNMYIGKYITLADVFLGMCMVSRAAGNFWLVFNLRLLENVDPDTAGDLLTGGF